MIFGLARVHVRGNGRGGGGDGWWCNGGWHDSVLIIPSL